MLPIVRRRHPKLGRLAPVLVVPHDDHTRAGDALLELGQEREVFVALLRAAFRAEPWRFSLELSGVRKGSPTFLALLPESPIGTFELLEEEPGSYLPVEGTIDEFRARLGDNFRRNLRKSGNRLGREPGASIRFLAGAEADPALLERFLALEASGWKGREGTSIERDPSLLAFYRALVGRFAASGWLEWHFLEIGGRLAAAHLAVRFGAALVLLKIAYDEEFARLGPGSLLFERVVERELASKASLEINCLTNMPWHRNWELPQALFAGLHFFPKRPWPLLAGVAPIRARRAMKRVPFLRALGRKLLGEGPDLPPDATPAVPREDATS